MHVEAVLTRGEPVNLARDADAGAHLLEKDLARDAVLADGMQHAHGPFTLCSFPHSADLGLSGKGLPDKNDSRRQQAESAKLHGVDPFALR